MNRKKCRNCGQYFRPEKPLQHYCLKAECVEEWVRVARQKQWKQRKAKLKEELKTVQDWTKEAQKVFNEYINLRDKGLPCVSCGVSLEGKKVNASHFYSAGGHFNVRFNEDNVHSSCIKCNMYLSGNLVEYGRRLPERIGKERFEALKQMANETANYSVEELKEIIYLYKQKIKECKTK
jgi:hypothetical protein